MNQGILGGLHRVARDLITTAIQSNNPAIRVFIKFIWWDWVALFIGEYKLAEWSLVNTVNQSYGRSDLLIKCHQRELEIEPNSASKNFQMACALMELARYKECLPFFKHAIELKPDWFGAYEVYGRALWICHEYDMASQVWTAGRNEQQRQANLNGYENCDFVILDSKWTKWLGNNSHIDAYIKLMLLGLIPKKRIKVVVTPQDVANEPYLRCWENHIELVVSEDIPPYYMKAMEYLAEPLHVFHTTQGPYFYYYAMGLAQSLWESQGRGPLIQFNTAYQESGLSLLRKMGIPEGAWFVCLHVRENGYWQEGNSIANTPRNAILSTYNNAIEFIIDSGGFVIRMGDASMSMITERNGLIDYAHSNHKSDWMDIFLCANARFFMGSNSALYHVCATFNKPSVLSNWIPLSSYPIQKNDFFIPKRMRRAKTGEYLTLAEMVALPRDVWSGEVFNVLNIQVINNTEQEILDVLIEMIEEESAHLARKHDNCDQANAIFKKANILNNGRMGSKMLSKLLYCQYE